MKKASPTMAQLFNASTAHPHPHPHWHMPRHAIPNRQQKLISIHPLTLIFSSDYVISIISYHIMSCIFFPPSWHVSSVWNYGRGLICWFKLLVYATCRERNSESSFNFVHLWLDCILLYFIFFLHRVSSSLFVSSSFHFNFVSFLVYYVWLCRYAGGMIWGFPC